MTLPSRSTMVGVSGHQNLSDLTRALVADEFRAIIARIPGPVEGICSLAAGADQIFAECILDVHARLRVVVPCNRYETTFGEPRALERFSRLLAAADQTETLPFEHPCEEAFFEAGKVVVQEADLLVAVWDGAGAAGVGGTADVVAYARELHREVIVVWPAGASRD